MIAFRRSELKEGEDWYRVHQGAKPAHMCPIAFTDGGYLKVLAKFKLQTNEQDIWPKIAIVTRTNWPNQKLMTVLIDGKAHNVIVANAKLFYPGAEVEVDRKGGKLICSQRPISASKLFQAIKRRHEETKHRKEIQ